MKWLQTPTESIDIDDIVVIRPQKNSFAKSLYTPQFARGQKGKVVRINKQSITVDIQDGGTPVRVDFKDCGSYCGEKPTITIKDLIENEDFDYIECRARVDIPLGNSLGKADTIFVGCFEAKNGEIISLDDDTYDENAEVSSFERWTNPEKNIQNGLTIITGEYISLETEKERE